MTPVFCAGVLGYPTSFADVSTTAENAYKGVAKATV